MIPLAMVRLSGQAESCPREVDCEKTRTVKTATGIDL